MKNEPTLLDTDTLSAMMRTHPAVMERAKSYLEVHGVLTFSLITRYEILRGLKAKEASSRIEAFDRLCAVSDVLPLTESIVDRAADIYADLRARGELIGDADILIAATALTHGLAVATNNDKHFKRVSGLDVENWLAT